MHIRNLKFDSSSVPLALLFFSFISYGLLIPWLGFYWDDWPAVWYLHAFGSSSYGDVFAVDRPLLGRLFMLTTPLLGTSVIGWQIFSILARWLSSLAFWWFLRGLWPGNPRQTALAALLFAVYPGFKQQYISVTYSHAWLIVLLFLYSYGAMSWGLRAPRYFWPMMISSWICAGLTLFTVEYFFGVELLRPAVLWMVLSDQLVDVRTKLRKTLILWLPYLILSVSFLVWRFSIYPTVRGHVDIVSKLSSDPLYIQELVETALVDILNSGLVAWGQVLNFVRMTGFGSGPTVFYISGVILAIGAAILYLLKFHPSGNGEDTQPRRRWGYQAMLLGSLALLLGGIPFWMTNLPIGLEFPWDRFTLAMIVGSSLLIAGVLDLITPNLLIKAITFGAVIGLAAGLHLQYSNLYRREWNLQKQFFWQLAWRAPAIEKGTLLLTAEMPFVYFSDNSLTAPLNWTYAPDFRGEQMPYLLYAAEARHEQSLANFDPGTLVHQPYRATFFDGSTSQSLVLFFTPPGCLKVVNPASDKRMPQKPKFISDMMPLSKLSLILPDGSAPARPPEQIFGSEPEPGWCYYFEKAELARQMENWAEVARLADLGLALDQELYEVNAPELVTYIDGYAHTAQWEKASQLTERTLTLSPRMDRMLCDKWNRLADSNSIQSGPGKESALATVRDQINCSLP